jgi:glycosyltransferase involved in cell wall biosynthesis
MRIGLEMFGTQTASRCRGIGRYCRNLASALLAAGPRSGHEFVLYIDSTRPADPTLIGPHARLRRLEPEPALRDSLGRLVRENSDRLDVLVLLNPLELDPGTDIPSRPIAGALKIAAIVYDLIPLLFPDGYLLRWPGTLQARRYMWALERLRSYDLVLAISETTRDDVIRTLAVPVDHVVTIGAAADDRAIAFSPGDDPADVAAIEALGLTGPFLFSVAAPDPRKNIIGLLNAFGRLPSPLLTAHKLALAARLSEADVEAANREAERLGIRKELVLLGQVSDPTLRALYRRCEAFVFPSYYEGFGLPILEAFQCGAPVIAHRSSAQPEAAGNAAVLVNANDPEAIAAAIVRILSDKSLAQSLRERGSAQARRFSWGNVAARLIAALEQLGGAARPHALRGGTSVAAYPTRSPGRRLRSPGTRVALFSPLPPTRSGVASYTAALLDALGERHAIDLFHGPDEHPFERFGSRSSGCFDARVFARLHRTRPYDAVIYQMGNSFVHQFMYHFMLSHPGIVVLHDLSLGSFHYERTVRLGGGLEAFRSELQATHADGVSDFKRFLRAFTTSPEAMIKDLSATGLDVNRRIVASARAVIVHSRAAAARLVADTTWAGLDKTFIAPLGADPAPIPLVPVDRARARTRLGLPTDALVFGSFGIVHPTKLNTAAIEAFTAVAARVPQALFLIVGEEADDGCARRCANALGLADRVRFWGRPGDDEFQMLVAATDVGVMLRRPPTNGESSWALLDLLRSGVATVVTDVGSFADYPDDVVKKVPWRDDTAGVEGLRREYLNLAADPSARDTLGRSAWQHVRANHTWDCVAARYAEVITWSRHAHPGFRPFRGPHHGRARREVAETERGEW